MTGMRGVPWVSAAGVQLLYPVITNTLPQFFTFPQKSGLQEGASSVAPSLSVPRCPSPGLSLVVGLVLYISSINDEMLNRTKDSESFFNYKYGWSFAFSAISFLLTEVPHPCNKRIPFPGVGRLRLFGKKRAQTGFKGGL